MGKFTATKSVDFPTYFYLQSDFKHEGNHVHTLEFSIKTLSHTPGTLDSRRG